MRGEKRRPDREDVRLPPRSFLQRYPAQVLMSQAQDERRRLGGAAELLVPRLFCDPCHVFRVAASTQKYPAGVRVQSKILPQSLCESLQRPG